MMRAVKYVIDKALALKMPLAVNISYGTNDGPHDGSSLFVSFLDGISRRWKTVICAAVGNEGAAGHHYAGNVAAGGAEDAEFTVAPSQNGLYVALYKNFADDFAIELFAPDGSSSGRITAQTPLREFGAGGAKVYIRYGLPLPYTESQEIFIGFGVDAGRRIPAGLWRLRVTGLSVIDGRFDAWLPTVEEVTAKTAFVRPEILTTLTLPATGKNIISVSGYDSRYDSAAAFSGRGSLAGGVSKMPDLAAPAVDVISSRTGGGSGLFTGTSIASPIVAGAAALLMEWGIVKGNDPFLYGQRLKAFLKKGARRDKGITYPDPVWGYGTLCVAGALEALRAFGK
jgi:subtilisin family serine protease